MSMTPEERRARNTERMRQYREANKEKEAERQRQYRKANKEKELEKKRRYQEVNKEKEAEQRRRRYESNKEKELEKKRRYQEVNKEKIAERKRQYREANKEAVAEKNRRYLRRKSFTRENGLSFRLWQASLYRPANVFAAIANLTPDEGQTLAELIHELSGYDMAVCEQIANPPIDETTETPQPTPLPDLF